MALIPIYGKSGSGKTSFLYEEIIQTVLNERNQSVIVIVPEQYTLETQHNLIRRHPGGCIMSIEVLSFQRLAYRFKTQSANQDKPTLSDVGKHMLLKKIIEEHQSEFKWIVSHANKSGYIKELKELMTEFYQYRMDSEKFKVLMASATSESLRHKLEDLFLLFNYYREITEQSYISSESTLEQLVQVLQEQQHQQKLKKFKIVIDGFYGFTPIQYGVILELLASSMDVYISVTIDLSRSDNPLYRESRKIIEQLNQICEKNHIQIKNPITMIDNNSSSPTLAHIKEYFYHYPVKVFKEKTNHIILSEAITMKEEVDYVADSVMNLVMKKGYNYKDIVILSGDLTGYKSIIEEAFNRYEIPYFIDQKELINHHPFVEMIISGLEIIGHNFRYNDVFRYAKAGYLDIDPEILYLVENYVLAYGIRGKSRWQSEWERIHPDFKGLEASYVEDMMLKINQGRLAILDSLAHLLLVKTGNIAMQINHLYDWLQAIEAETTLWRMSETFRQNKQLSLNIAYRQVFGTVIGVFEQIVDINIEEETDIDMLIQVLLAGFEVCEIGIIPPALDQVVIGDLERSRFNESKALFVIGLNDGKVPKNHEKASIITDFERQTLLTSGIELAPDNKRYLYQEQFNIYMGLTRVSQRLYLSYASIGFDGKSMRPSLIIHMIERLFPNLKPMYIKDMVARKLIINKEKPTFYRLLDYIDQMKSSQNEEKLEAIKSVMNWYLSKEKWRVLYEDLLAFKATNKIEAHLSSAIVKALYGDVFENSVSRLESFAKCPFAHFVDYGLKLKDRPEFVVKMPDVGIIFHKAIERVAFKLDKVYHINWETLDDLKRHTIVLESVAEVIEEEKRGLFIQSARTKYLINKMTRIVDRAIWAIAHQITSGQFRPIGHEYKFSSDDDHLSSIKIDFDEGRSMKLRGTVDRADYFEADDTGYLTVIDYKSGQNKIDLVALYYGMQLQLFVYMNAMKEVKSSQVSKEVKPAGLFYFHVEDPLILSDKHMTYEDIESLIMNKLKLDGIFLQDDIVLGALDNHVTKSSNVIPLSYNKDGSIKKNDNLVDEETFATLLSFTNHKVKEIGKDILDGNVAIKPYQYETEKGCDYCKHKSICQFDAVVDDYHQMDKLSREELLEKITKD
ncbi:MAG: helicase-exonuclease AddAB subunit AddB [Vallitaleaceae bacterium]|nr:helicase-exonuclease AddAB subunit AddB [Vallitaleaceae bacterium]